MIDHLKITKTTAIEALSNCNSNSDLILIGTSPLKFSFSSLKVAVENGVINDSSSFKNVFGYNVNFFYVIEQVDNNVVVNYERGIGCIYQKDGNTYLNRKISFVIGKNSVESGVNKTGTPFPFKCVNHNMVIYSSLPPTYFECLAPTNSVLTSSESCIPQPVPLVNDSFLARLQDGIEAISFSDSRLIDKISNLISKFSKQLKLKTSKLSVKRVEVEAVDLIPTTEVKAKKGSFYYDEHSDTIKVYNGTSWRSLSFIKDDV